MSKMYGNTKYPGRVWVGEEPPSAEQMADDIARESYDPVGDLLRPQVGRETGDSEAMTDKDYSKYPDYAREWAREVDFWKSHPVDRFRLEDIRHGHESYPEMVQTFDDVIDQWVRAEDYRKMAERLEELETACLKAEVYFDEHLGLDLKWQCQEEFLRAILVFQGQAKTK